jgi:hypothetical protein
MATPLMNLDLPVVGPSGTIGPTYATMLNTALNLVDSHDHTTGKGPKVTPAGINVNANFNFNSFGQYNVNYLKLVDQSATVSDFVSVFAKDGDLYWKNDGGVDVQITLGNTINAAAAGGIGGDYTTSTASVTYSDITKTYTFKQSPTITGDIAAGSLYVYENVVSGKYAKIKVPTGLAGNYDLTLPSALPGSTLPLFLSSSGVLSTAETIGAVMGLASTDNSTLEVSAGATRIKDLGVTTGKIADGAVTPAKRSALGQQISASTGNLVFTSSATFTNITNAVVTITTTGRPVALVFQADGTTNEAGLGVDSGTTFTSDGVYAFTRDGTQISAHRYQVRASGVSSDGFSPSGLFYVDTPAAGTYVYRVQFRTLVATTTSISASYMKLLAFEL